MHIVRYRVNIGETLNCSYCYIQIASSTLASLPVKAPDESGLSLVLVEDGRGFHAHAEAFLVAAVLA